MFLYKKAAGAGGVGGGAITGSLVSAVIGTSTAPTLSEAPQDGDLLISFIGGYAFNCTFASGITQINARTGSPWSGSYIETIKLGYRICNGTEAQAFNAIGSGNFDRRQCNALYRFNKKVTGVTNVYTGNSTQTFSTTIPVNSTLPHIVMAGQGAYQARTSNMNLSYQDFNLDLNYIHCAATLNTENTGYTGNYTVTSASVLFNEANAWNIITLSF
jgi:hypothetical protein